MITFSKVLAAKDVQPTFSRDRQQRPGILRRFAVSVLLRGAISSELRSTREKAPAKSDKDHESRTRERGEAPAPSHAALRHRHQTSPSLSPRSPHASLIPELLIPLSCEMPRTGGKHASPRYIVLASCLGLLAAALIADFLWSSSNSQYLSATTNWSVDEAIDRVIASPKTTPRTTSKIKEKTGPAKGIASNLKAPNATFADLPGPRLEWEEMAAAPVPRLDGAAIQIKNLLYVFAGYGTIDLVHSHVDIYNFVDNSWGGRFDMPKEMAHSHLGMVTDGRYIYVVTGQYGPQCRGPTARNFVLDTETKQWRDLPPLPVPRYAPATQLWRGRLHVMGGSREDRHEPALEHWSLAVKNGKALEKDWRSEIPIPRGGPHRNSLQQVVSKPSHVPEMGCSGGRSSNAIETHGVGHGGRNSLRHCSADILMMKVWQNDKGLSYVWLRSMDRSVDEEACIVVDDHLLVIGGQEGDFMAKPGSPIFKCARRSEVVYGDVYMLDDDEMKWKQLPPMPKPDSHIEFAWVIVNNSIVIAGGTTQNHPVTKKMVLNGELFRFRLDTLEWSVIGKLPFRIKTTLVGFWDGWLYFTSGQRDKGPDDPAPKKVIGSVRTAALPPFFGVGSLSASFSISDTSLFACPPSSLPSPPSLLSVSPLSVSSSFLLLKDWSSSPKNLRSETVIGIAVYLYWGLSNQINDLDD
ncbi:hypothetical protein ACLOJK_009103 [Asimina triloba]